jgi:hypothetical protein
MKKTLVIGALLAGATGLFAQGTVQFTDLGAVQIHIYGPQVADPSVQVTGNTASDKPAGTQTGYTGGLVGGTGTGTSLANGNDVSVELYALGGGTSAAPLSSLQAVSQYTSTIYTIAAGAGVFVKPSLATDPGIPNSANGSATIALAAWYNGGGSYTSLSAAQAAGQPAGESAPVFLSGLGGLGQPPGTPPPMTGLQSFSLTSPAASPEPSTIALGVMGASAFLLRRRMSK